MPVESAHQCIFSKTTVKFCKKRNSFLSYMCDGQHCRIGDSGGKCIMPSSIASSAAPALDVAAKLAGQRQFNNQSRNDSSKPAHVHKTVESGCATVTCCQMCGIQASGMLKCGRCLVFHYCSVECQVYYFIFVNNVLLIYIF